MKTFLVFFVFVNLFLLNPTNAKIISFDDEQIQSPDTTAVKYKADIIDSTDYSIEFRASNGSRVNLGNWRGENLLVIYAHSDCSYCMDLVNKYEAELQDTTLPVIVLFSGSDTTEIKEFIEETSLKYPYYIDYKFQFRRKYAAPVVPVTFFINADGTAERIPGLKLKPIEDLIRRINKS